MARGVKRKDRRPLIVIGCEGGKNSSEQGYFGNFRTRDLRIQFATGNSTDSRGMWEDLTKYIRKEDIISEDKCAVFLVLDTDLDPARIDEIRALPDNIDGIPVQIIISTPTFEIWYLMHSKRSGLTFGSSGEVKRGMAKMLGREYKESMNVFPILENKTMNARRNAQNIEKRVLADGVDVLEANPYSGIYKILDKIDEFST